VAWSAEWRTKGELADAVLVLDDNGVVHNAFSATPSILSRMLTEMSDLWAWRGQGPIEGEKRDPESWGTLVIARGSGGEVLEVEPELFWKGIYQWFRSHGVDYDTPGLKEDGPPEDPPYVPPYSAMDD
jgi:hypothetical protein